MKKHQRQRIEQIIKTLELALRLGESQDTPEGTRYIQLSDTLAQRMADDLKAVIK